MSADRDVDPDESRRPQGLVEELVPDDLDWRELVREYPIPALIVAGIGGFVLGRNRGPELLSALSAFAADRVSTQVNELLGEEVL